MAFASEPNTLSDHQSVVNEMLYSIAGFGSVKSSSYPSPCASNGTTYNSTSFTGGRCGSAPPLSSGPSECDNGGWVEHEGPEGTGCFRQLNNDKRKPFKWYSRKGFGQGDHRAPGWRRMLWRLHLHFSPLSPILQHPNVHD